MFGLRVIISWFLSIPSHTGVPIANGLKKADHFSDSFGSSGAELRGSRLPFMVGEIVLLRLCQNAVLLLVKNSDLDGITVYHQPSPTALKQLALQCIISHPPQALKQLCYGDLLVP